jgi:acyl-CoA thioesterase FadM
LPLQDGSPRDGQASQLRPARIRVRFADTDAMGVVYYANDLSVFETGRIEAMRQIVRPMILPGWLRDDLNLLCKPT